MKKFVYQEDDSKRIDGFLALNKDFACEFFSRNKVQRFLKEGLILVNGKSVKANYLLKTGDEIEINEEEKADVLRAENMNLEILYEDDDFAVINKPEGISVHGASEHDLSPTLVNGLKFQLRNLSGVGDEIRPGIVHRLDKGTSGVLLVAKNDKAHLLLSEQIKNRQVEKKYLALVCGFLEPNFASIDAPIARSLADRKKMAVSKSGKEALTKYQVLARGKMILAGFERDFSLLEVEIVTGRTHQIRVHLSSIGFPVLGDEVYGNSKINEACRKIGLDRMFLHAFSVGVRFPLDAGEKSQIKSFYAPLPLALKEFLCYNLGISCEDLKIR
jgi:23S rRNA pseudouridine1911/1915/1917 synthase